MATQTPNLGLTQPSENEQYDINVVNANTRKLDNFAGDTWQSISQITGEVAGVGQSVDEINEKIGENTDQAAADTIFGGLRGIKDTKGWVKDIDGNLYAPYMSGQYTPVLLRQGEQLQVTIPTFLDYDPVRNLIHARGNNVELGMFSFDALTLEIRNRNASFTNTINSVVYDGRNDLLHCTVMSTVPTIATMDPSTLQVLRESSAVSGASTGSIVYDGVNNLIHSAPSLVGELCSFNHLTLH